MFLRGSARAQTKQKLDRKVQHSGVFDECALIMHFQQHQHTVVASKKKEGRLLAGEERFIAYIERCREHIKTSTCFLPRSLALQRPYLFQHMLKVSS